MAHFVESAPRSRCGARRRAAVSLCRRAHWPGEARPAGSVCRTRAGDSRRYRANGVDRHGRHRELHPRSRRECVLHAQHHRTRAQERPGLQALRARCRPMVPREQHLCGPWTYVAANALPSDFSEDPGFESDRKRKGIDSRDQASARRRHCRDRSRKRPPLHRILDCTVAPPRFDGAPTFKPLEGTSLEYAVNTATPIVRVGGSVYAVENGIWFTASSVDGPWRLATSVPIEIYSIPPTSPLYYVTFARIYATSGDTMFVGYTPGYQGTYIDRRANSWSSTWYRLLLSRVERSRVVRRPDNLRLRQQPDIHAVDRMGHRVRAWVGMGRRCRGGKLGNGRVALVGTRGAGVVYPWWRAWAERSLAAVRLSPGAPADGPPMPATTIEDGAIARLRSTARTLVQLAHWHRECGPAWCDREPARRKHRRTSARGRRDAER